MDLTKVPTNHLIAELESRAANNFTTSEADLERVAMSFHEAAENARLRREAAASYTWEDRQTSNLSMLPNGIVCSQKEIESLERR